MKKINSIAYSGKLFVAGLFNVFLLPPILKKLFPPDGAFHLLPEALGLIIPAVIFLFFKIELTQDGKNAQQYQEDLQYRKLPLTKDGFECQFCGNRKIKNDEKSCPVCGTTWKGSGDCNERPRN